MTTRVFAEYDEPTDLARGIDAARAWGPVRLEAYTPYPVPAIERALAAPPSRLSPAVFAAGLGAAAGAYGLQWLLNAYLYPVDIGGRPNHFPLAFVPITFEMGVLFASLTAFVGVILGGRMLRLWHHVFDVDGIESATGTQFWLEIDPIASEGDLEALTAALHRTGARVVRRGGGPP